MGYKTYTDGERAEALIMLWSSKYDYDQVATDTGVSVKTLRRWDKDAPKKNVPELLDRAIQRMLMAIPKDMTGHDWSIALGIMMDKWLLIQGQPTERTESVSRILDDLPEDEYSAVIHEAETIIARATGSFGNGQGPSEEA